MASTTFIIFSLLATFVFFGTLQTTTARRLLFIPGNTGIPATLPVPSLPPFTPLPSLPPFPLTVPSLQLPPFTPPLPTIPNPLTTPSTVPPFTGIFTPPVAGTVHP
ncbi:hypothetical protein QVD17_30347 [Tagetes erecta]|uniref:Uncharacterized protein n=1 Tax=Tagetes erecta TaxID=13708 RepID=A0AAD8NFX7_TARER|nr:hypothetical protein QVD17_30347 [Tagetes erecta]